MQKVRYHPTEHWPYKIANKKEVYCSTDGVVFTCLLCPKETATVKKAADHFKSVHRKANKTLLYETEPLEGIFALNTVTGKYKCEWKECGKEFCRCKWCKGPLHNYAFRRHS